MDRFRPASAEERSPPLFFAGLHQILLNLQIPDDEVLPLGRVLTHVEREQLVGVVQMIERNRIKADVFADEIFELVRRDFAEALETRDLVGRTELRDGSLLLGLVVTVDRFLFIPHPEQRGFENREMAARDQVGEKLQEKREQEQADVHPVHVGIRGDDDFAVTH